MNKEIKESLKVEIFQIAKECLIELSEDNWLNDFQDRVAWGWIST